MAWELCPTPNWEPAFTCGVDIDHCWDYVDIIERPMCSRCGAVMKQVPMRRQVVEDAEE